MILRFFTCLWIVLLCWPAPLAAGSIATVSVDATNVRLAELLRQLADRAGFSLSLKAPAREPVSFSANNETVEPILNRLLAEYNFVLLYKDKEAGRLSKVIVVSRKNPVREEAALSPPELAIIYQQADGLPGSGNASAPGTETGTGAEALADSLFREIRREQLPAGDLLAAAETATAPLTIHRDDGFFQANRSPKGGKGIVLKTLPMGSPLRHFGLEQGDVVREVDGTPVETAADLEKALEENIDKEGRAPMVLGIERPASTGELPPGSAPRDNKPRAMHLYVSLAP